MTRKARNQRRSGGASGSITPALPASVKLVFEGDSITLAGYGTNALPYLPAGPEYTSQTLGTSGATSTLVNTNYSTRAGAAFNAAKNQNILTLMIGTNDGALVVPIDIYRNIRSIMRKAKATGYQHRLIGTIPSRNNSGAFSGNTLPLNLWIRALYNSDLEGDGLFDFAADSRFDTTADANSLTFYNADKWHPNTDGQLALGEILGAALVSRLTTVSISQKAPLTWSPYDLTDTHMSISNSDRTITRSSTGVASAQAKAFNGAIANKAYWECALDLAFDVSVGLCNRTYEPFLQAGTKTPIDNVDSIGCSPTGDFQYNNGISLGSVGAFQNGDVLQNCLDMSRQRWWMRRNGGNWNGNASADPATGVGGIDISGLGAGPIYPIAWLRQEGAQVTSRFAANQFSASIPTGFSTL